MSRYTVWYSFNLFLKFHFNLLFRYNSGGKKFTKIHTKSLTVTIDGFTIHNALWLGKKANLPSKRDMALVVWWSDLTRFLTRMQYAINYSSKKVPLFSKKQTKYLSQKQTNKQNQVTTRKSDTHLNTQPHMTCFFLQE